jgi:hypothetical protein
MIAALQFSSRPVIGPTVQYAISFLDALSETVQLKSLPYRGIGESQE